MTISLNTKKGTFRLQIDAEDLHLIQTYGVTVWKAPSKSTYYARFTKGNLRNKPVHRIILSTNKQIDHKNGDGLDNRKCNLREASNQENCRNRKRKNYTSKFSGVSFKRDVIKGKTYTRWIARIQINPTKRIQLGSFKTELEAAKAYDKAAKKIFWRVR